MSEEKKDEIKQDSIEDRQIEEFEASKEQPTQTENDLDGFEDDQPVKLQKRQRPIWLTLGIIAVCLYMMFSYRADLFFYFAKSEPAPLGNAIGFEAGDLPNNSYASIIGIRNPSKGVKLNVLFSNRNVFQLMGTTKVFVETIAENDKKTSELHEEVYSGRFMRFKDVSYFNTVRDFAAYNFGSDIPEDAILIKAHEKPGEMQHVILIYLISLAILLLNLVLIIKRIRTKQD